MTVPLAWFLGPFDKKLSGGGRVIPNIAHTLTSALDQVFLDLVLYTLWGVSGSHTQSQKKEGVNMCSKHLVKPLSPWENA